MRRNFSRVIIGLIFIAAGIIFLGNALDIWELNIFFPGWWTLFIIVPAVCAIVSSGYSTGKLIWLLVGVMLLLSRQQIISDKMTWGIALAAIIIFIGLSIIFGGIFRNHKVLSNTNIGVNSSVSSSESAVFSGRNINFNNQKFEGIKISSVFGSIQLDLRQAIIEHDVAIDADTVFGGIEILLPQNVKLIISADSVFGGIDNKYDNTAKEGMPSVVLRGSCVFAGIEIR